MLSAVGNKKDESRGKTIGNGIDADNGKAIESRATPGFTSSVE